MEVLRSCVENGFDVENGLHVFLGNDPELSALAAERGVELRDLRRPPADLSTATGANLGVDATIVLTVGSDCAIGKMTVALELDLEARRRGAESIFVPTGQTGIAIAGWGISVDAVVADFIAGAAERLVVEGALDALKRHGADMDVVSLVRVPGSWEMPTIASGYSTPVRTTSAMVRSTAVRASPRIDVRPGLKSGGGSPGKSSCKEGETGELIRCFL